MLPRTGVLLTAFGGPSDLDGIVPFMRSLLGMEPPEAMVAGTRRKYLAIGGRSPLPAMGGRIAAAVEAALRVPVALGMRHAEPSIASAIGALAARDVRTVVVVSLSPFDAEVTTGAYATAVQQALAEHPGMHAVAAQPYHLATPFVGFLAEAVVEALAGLGAPSRRVLTVLTAHSLPVEDLERDPSYVVQLQQTASAVTAIAKLGTPGVFAGLAGVEAFGRDAGPTPWLLAFQSKGRRGGAWAGPDLDDVIDHAAAAGFEAVAVCPIGFALDHMETLYDLDVRAADRARAAGLEFGRAAVPNDDPRMIESLERAVRSAR